jgi:hypothetical protein
LTAASVGGGGAAEENILRGEFAEEDTPVIDPSRDG